MIRLLVDSSSDFELSELKDMDFVPITVSLGEKNYRDGIDLNKDQLYEMLQDTDQFPKTAQPSPAEFIDLFEAAKAKGDQLICFILSSGLSGAYQSAVLAKSIVGYDGIHLIDTLNATHGIRYMVEYAKKLIADGLTAEEIVKKIEDFKPRIRIMAAVDTLEYLSRGGRLNRTAAAIGELANLKPIVGVSSEGKVEVFGKALGRLKAIQFLVKQINDADVDTDFPVYSLYSYGTENLEKLEDKMINSGYSITQRLQIGATIGAHLGPGAFGLSYVIK